MSLVPVKKGFAYPSLVPTNQATTPTLTTFSALTAAGQKQAIIFQASRTGNIRKIGYRVNVITGTPTIDVRLETVNTATGAPTGTLVSTNSNFSHSPVATGWYELTLTSDAAVTAGDYYSITFATSGTFTAFGIAAYSDETTGTPYTNRYDGSVWSSTQQGIVATIEYSDGVIDNNLDFLPANTTTIETYNNSSSPNHRGIKLTMPFQCKVDGCWVWADLDGDVDMVLYDTDGVSVLATAQTYANTPPNAGAYISYLNFDTEVTLAKGGVYYLAFKPTTATNATAYSFGFNSANLNPYANEVIWVEATNPTGVGSWTEYNTELAWMGLMISEIQDSASGTVGYATFY